MSGQEVVLIIEDNQCIIGVGQNVVHPALVAKSGSINVEAIKQTRAVVFNTVLPDTDYNLILGWENTVDSPITAIDVPMTTTKSVSGFTASWNQPTPTDKYRLIWTVVPIRDP